MKPANTVMRWRVGILGIAAALILVSLMSWRYEYLVTAAGLLAAEEVVTWGLGNQLRLSRWRAYLWRRAGDVLTVEMNRPAGTVPAGAVLDVTTKDFSQRVVILSCVPSAVAPKLRAMLTVRPVTLRDDLARRILRHEGGAWPNGPGIQVGRPLRGTVLNFRVGDWFRVSLTVGLKLEGMTGPKWWTTRRQRFKVAGHPVKRVDSIHQADK